MIRYPRYAGSFYEGTLDALNEQLEECFRHPIGPGTIPKASEQSFQFLALISPHAGYMFSGPVAAHGFGFAALTGRPDTVIIIGPNHTGHGSGLSIAVRGTWRTPLGDVDVDAELANKVQRASKLLDIDDSAHQFEHSIEIQLPFLQYIYGSTFKLIPISMRMQDLEASQDVGMAIAKTILNRKVLLIASTDLSHYESHREAKTKDQLVINSILALNEGELQSTVFSKSVSMCGYGPTSAIIIASKKLGATQPRLLAYCTSGDTSGDYSRVVGYASIVLSP
ncbi:MAG: AmmeMemoRadiSam system protein B [Candidatus Bathyarchaeota archaeon]|nr:MAG: AmmeMemoRadiSam system protein B [Candidatus Bathyarchaeota archaeon]